MFLSEIYELEDIYLYDSAAVDGSSKYNNVRMSMESTNTSLSWGYDSTLQAYYVQDNAINKTPMLELLQLNGDYEISMEVNATNRKFGFGLMISDKNGYRIVTGNTGGHTAKFTNGSFSNVSGDKNYSVTSTPFFPFKIFKQGTTLTITVDNNYTYQVSLDDGYTGLFYFGIACTNMYGEKGYYKNLKIKAL